MILKPTPEMPEHKLNRPGKTVRFSIGSQGGSPSPIFAKRRHIIDIAIIVGTSDVEEAAANSLSALFLFR